MGVQYKSLVEVFGDKFNAVAFQDSLPPELKGEVGTIRNWTTDQPEGRRYYWSSKSILDEQLEANLGERCCNILSSLNDYILPLANDPTNEIYCTIVAHFEDEESVSGFWFSSKVIQILSKYNAQINIDSYCYASNSENDTS